MHLMMLLLVRYCCTAALCLAEATLTYSFRDIDGGVGDNSRRSYAIFDTVHETYISTARSSCY
jgi:hypothetical protein